MSNEFLNTREGKKGTIKKSIDDCHYDIDELLSRVLTELDRILGNLEHGYDKRLILVSLSSLIDFFYSQIMKYIVPIIFHRERELPTGWSNFKISLDLLKDVFEEIQEFPESYKWIDNAYHENYHLVSTQNPENIKLIMDLIKDGCFDDFLELHETNILQKLRESDIEIDIDIKRELGTLYKRRNQIVHDYDFNIEDFPNRNPLKKEFVRINILINQVLFEEIVSYIKNELK